MSDHSRLGVGDVAPRLSLTDPDGRPVAIDPAQHDATVVVFTSRGCPYALAWQDRVDDVDRDYAGRGVAVVQVLSNDPVLQPLDAPGAAPGTQLHDPTQSVARAFGATATPEVFVLDATGTVRYHGAPDGSYDDPSLRAGWIREALDAVLAGGAVERPESPVAGCALKWRVELLWWWGCPSHDRAQELLGAALAQLQRQDVRVEKVEVTSPVQAAERDFVGSPTFQIGGVDAFPEPGGAPALTCRVYRLDDGRAGPLPSAAQLTDRLRDALVRPWELPGWVEFRSSAARS